MKYTFSPAADFDRLEEAAAELYVPSAVSAQIQRYRRLFSGFAETFGPCGRAAVFSAPGRTEIGGNHTDHQHGRVLAGSIDLDIIAVAAPNGEGVIRLKSEGFPMDVVELDDLEIHPEEYNRSVSILRGIAAWFARQGCRLEGFNAYTVSNVFKGSGLSSSAALEVLLGNIFNSLFHDGKCTPVQLAQIGQYAENVYFGKPSGLLDQMGSSMGGMVTIDFQDNDHPVVEKIDFDFASAGHALCIIDSGADHADLTDEYAAVPGELKKVCAHFGKSVLREVPEADFYASLPALRRECGDRAVLRAIHIYDENRRVQEQIAALRRNDFPAFLAQVRLSGLSSWRYLQNVVPAGYKEHQEVAVALAAAERLLNGRGACRVHGGGFAGTIQAFVPLDMLEGFKSGMEQVLGDGRCHVLSVRSVGGVRLV
ncbi:MAG: galactokinase [Oscillospiraceae bacterium]|nr:galactokinase [Oscillospiraceae bacterium]